MTSDLFLTLVAIRMSCLATVVMTAMDYHSVVSDTSKRLSRCVVWVVGNVKVVRYEG